MLELTQLIRKVCLYLPKQQQEKQDTYTNMDNLHYFIFYIHFYNKLQIYTFFLKKEALKR